MTTKRRTVLLIISVMILMMHLHSSESVKSRMQMDRRWDKALGRKSPSKSIPSSPRTMTMTCPALCTCRHKVVRCDKGSRMVFPSIPKEVKQLYLSGSKIQTLEPGDISPLVYLSSLSLANTGLKNILAGAFRDNSDLDRLDLSYNQLTSLDYDTLTSLPNLRVLKANNNQLSCVDPALKYLTNLQILNIHSNLLTSLPTGVFSFLPRLRQLRLDDNKIDCSCGVAWLASFLRKNPSLGVGTFCHHPQGVAGKSVSTLLSYQIPCQGHSRAPARKCRSVSKCPDECKCSHGVVDCRNLGLTKIPANIPYETVELRLENNLITEIGPHAFKTSPSLKRIDLSRNLIENISPESFRLNNKLTTLILYDNKLSVLPTSVLQGLNNLHMILLNKNNISCLQQEVFRDQNKLVLLSLYDNNLVTLPRNIFQHLSNIQTLYLGANPWYCDCHLYWLPTFCSARGIQSSGATCAAPSSLQNQDLDTIPAESFTCQESVPTVYDDKSCKAIEKCPASCNCADGLVDCTGQGLSTVPHPDSLPLMSHSLQLGRNSLANMKGISDICSRHPDLTSIGLQHNMINSVGKDDFMGCYELEEVDISHNNIAIIDQESFTGLTKLKKLKLLGNYIICFDKKFLMKFEYVPVIEIDLRFFECNCESKWMSEWINKKRFRALNFNCKDLDKCSESVSTDCAADIPCPAKCTCKGDVVRCSQRMLEEMPADVPLLTQELLVNNNNITTINNGGIRALVRLELLDLSNNNIQFLEEESFPNLPKLKSLILLNNKIQCIQGGAFKRMPKLQLINLEQNNIAGFDKSVFSNYGTVSSLAMGGNPLHCDCRLSWLASMVKRQDLIENTHAQCVSPPHLQDRYLQHIPHYSLVCTGDPVDPVQARCDPCYAQPCHNGGMCISMISNKQSHYMCECSSLYTGDRCQTMVDVCHDNPCGNGGSCSVSVLGSLVCDCVTGWEGRLCETSTDDCIGHHCKNSASCIDRHGYYECQCSEGYRGPYCEEKIPECELSSTVCDDRGTCKAGNDCDAVVKHHDCHGLCQHGGSCVQGECVCPPHYGGVYCEVPHYTVATLYQATSPCYQHSCRHGVCLSTSDSAGYTCQCHPGYSGKNCEYLTTVQLVGQYPYIEVDPLFTSRALNLTVVLKTKEPSGVILYHGDKDHLAVELFHGRVRVSLNVGNDPSSTMFSYAVLNDDKPHAVELLLDGKNLTMRIDGGLARSLINNGPKEKLRVARSTFLGGLPEDVGESALGQWHLRNSTSLKGCIINFFMDEKMIDFLQAAHHKRGILSGCFKRYLDGTINDAHEDNAKKETMKIRKDKRTKKKRGCKQNKCRSTGTRKCLPKGRRNYKCKCKRGYAGRYCEKVPTCRKKKIRSYMEENGCRSRKLLSQKLCKGSCHDGGCCKPKKVKKKKIGMICQDGTRYIKTVDIVKKCSCAKPSTCKNSRVI